MCGRFALATPPEALVEIFDLFEAPDPDPLRPRYNIAPTQSVAVIRLNQSGAHRELAMMHWGLIPSWADSPSIGNRLINARSESAGDRPAFRGAFRKRRCLIPADGFYEWMKTERGKQPYYIHRTDGRPFAFAGLWECWRADQETEPVESCTILTTPANAVVAPIHNRMPAMLEKSDFARWLDPGDDDPSTLHELLRPFESDAMAAHPVSIFVNKPKNDSTKCIEPLESDDGAEGQRELFS